MNKSILVLLLLFILSCNKNKNNNPTPVNPPAGDNSIDYHFIDIPVSSQPLTIEELVKEDIYSKPNSPYGVRAFLDFLITENPEEIAIFWISNTKEKNLIIINYNNGKIIRSIPIPDFAKSGKHLGIQYAGNGKYLIGNTKTNSFGDEDSEAWYTLFDQNGNVSFSTRIFGEQNNSEKGAKHSPGHSSNAVISIDNTIAGIFLGYSESTNQFIRHQGGWMGFLDLTNGQLLKNKEGNHIGSTWYYSHNFDQRLQVLSDKNYYSLSHGDSFERALTITKWSSENGFIKDNMYHIIKYSKPNDNVTEAHTGDFTELENGSIAIIYSTSDDRTSRDLKLSLLNKNDLSVISQHWLTNLSSNENIIGWGSKIVDCKNGEILVGYNNYKVTPALEWGNTNFHFENSTSTLLLLDDNGNQIQNLALEELTFTPTQSMKLSSDNSKVIFLSSKSNNTLRVHIVNLN